MDVLFLSSPKGPPWFVLRDPIQQMALSIISQKRRRSLPPAAAQSNARPTLASKITSHSSPHHICALTPRRVWRQLDRIQRKSRRRSSRTAVIHWIPSVNSDTLMASTVEELYRNYGILADEKEDLSKVNKASYLCVVRLKEKCSLDIPLGGVVFI